MAFPQKDRLLRVYGAPLAADNVILTGLSGHEAMSRLYSFQLEMACQDLSLNAENFIGKPVKVEIASQDEKSPVRYVNGYISRLSAGEISGEADAKTQFRVYRAELVPWLWFLTQTARCFIYFPEREDKSIFEIIEAVLKRASSDLHVGDQAKFNLDGIDPLKQRKVKHCVQYRETDFNFLSRILEQYGAYYYFKQTDGGHELVISMDGNYPDAAQSSIKHPTGTAAGKSSTDHIHSWEHSYEFVSGKWAHTDYNFETPTAALMADSGNTKAKHPDASKYEVYDYPGEYSDSGEGKDDARVRQEEEELPHDTVSASSGCRALMPGHKFKLEARADKSNATEVGEYLVTSIHHHASQSGPESGGGAAATYSNSFSCVPRAVQFRAARITPKPVVSGIQTAVVVGPSSEEIYTDKYGRIMVAFHWDREDSDREDKPRKKVDNGEKFYCWIRVAQNIAGNKWGFMAIPRIGQEVVVDFIEGDPDRPLVIGGVYNEGQMPHYDPDEHKTRTYIKTNSSPGGDGHNELRFEDKADEEQIYIHAERNMDVRVKNDSMELIYGNRHQVIGWEDKEGEKGGDQKEEIKRDRHLKVHKDHIEHIGGDAKILIGGIDGDGNQDVVIKKDAKLLVEGDQHRHVMGNNLESIDGNRNTNIGGDQVMEIGGSSAHIAGADHLMKGMNISIEGQAICLKSGGNSITIDPSGVTIVGTLVRVNSGPAPPVISQAGFLQSQAPEDAEEAEPAEPTKADTSTTGAKSSPN
jgi:type VI secretion system secreted protein VgrG